MGVQINHQEVLPLSWTALPKVGVRVLMSAITVDWSCCISSSVSGPTAEYSHQRPWQGQLPFSVITLHTGPILSYPDFFYGVMTLLYSQTNFPFCFLAITINSSQFLVLLFLFLKVVFSENKSKLHEGTSMASGPWRTDKIWSCRNSYERRGGTFLQKEHYESRRKKRGKHIKEINVRGNFYSLVRANRKNFNYMRYERN